VSQVVQDLPPLRPFLLYLQSLIKEIPHLQLLMPDDIFRGYPCLLPLRPCTIPFPCLTASHALYNIRVSMSPNVDNPSSNISLPLVCAEIWNLCRAVNVILLSKSPLSIATLYHYYFIPIIPWQTTMDQITHSDNKIRQLRRCTDYHFYTAAQ
jgi:hypothetical protein